MSSNEKPQHQKCPVEETSWCFHNRGLASGKNNQNYNKIKMNLSPDLVSKILPVYQRIASRELLIRCTSGKIRNSNDSVYNFTWKYCPKETFV